MSICRSLLGAPAVPHVTLPWRGRVASAASGVGWTRSAAQYFHPTPTASASLRRSPLPLQGRVSGVCLALCALGTQVLLQEREDLGPAVGCLLGAVRHAGPVEEGVAGAVVTVKLVILAELLEHLLGAIDVGRAGVLVVVA